MLLMMDSSGLQPGMSLLLVCLAAACGMGQPDKKPGGDLACFGEVERPPYFGPNREEAFRATLASYGERPAGVGGTAFVGDSITSRADLDRLYPGRTNWNFGIEGDEVTGLLARFHYVEALDPHVIVLLIGTNDVARGRDLAAMKSTYELLFDRAVDEVKQADRLVVISVLPRGDDALDPRIDDINGFLRVQADKRGFRFVDAYREMTPDGRTIEEGLSHDGVHLTREGYARLGEIVGDALPEAVAEPQSALVMTVAEVLEDACYQ